MSRFLTGVVFAQIVAGPVGGAFGEYVSWRGVFLLLAGAALTMAGLMAAQLRSLGPAPPTDLSLRSYNALLQPGRAALLLLTLFDGVVFTGTVPFIGPFLHERLGLPYAGAGLVLACFGLGTLAYVRTAKRLVPALGEPRLVLSGALVAASGMALAAVAVQPLLFVLVELLLGLGYFMLHSVLQARATEMLPQARGTATSGFAFMLFMGQALGALLCAPGIERLGYRGVFAMDGVAILILGLLLSRLFRIRAG